MTPRTRKSNQEANFKVYYSKKVPQQTHFPHRRKVVRRPGPEQDGSEGRQMKFLPKKMRTVKGGTVLDSEDEEDEDEDDALSLHSDEEHNTTKVADHDIAQHSDMVQGVSYEERESIEPAAKRRRKEGNPRRKRLSNATSEADDGEKPSRKLRRQSTMTQLADGRLPDSDAEEPEFRRVNRKSRTSLGGREKNEKDTKQRTLTQMIPGMVLLADEEVEDMDDFQVYEASDQTDGESVTQRLSQQGLFMSAANNEGAQLDVQDPTDPAPSIEEETDKPNFSPNTDQTTPPPAVESVKDEPDDDEYFPTQFIDAPARKVRRTSRRQPNEAATAQGASKVDTPRRGNPRKSRFSLLSTPEKRRVFEIASSQSPAESLISTQTSPVKTNPPVLQERTHDINSVPDTPSKRKRVTFQAEPKQYGPPPTLRRFRSTIQDSEDEGSDIEENFSDASLPSTHTTESMRHGKPVGEHTQAVLNQIDQACADADDDMAWSKRDSSEELGGATTYNGPHEASPELGESWAPVLYDDLAPDVEASYRSTRSNNSSFPLANDTSSIEAAPLPDIQLAGSPSALDNSRAELPSTPMALPDESSEAEELDLTTPRTSRYNELPADSAATHQSTDLDGEPIQVPRSPSALRETQQSHSSGAEQQLQTEWLSYSQYVGARPPQTSSVLAHDANSYIPTARQPQSLLQDPPVHLSSQATTVDEITPRKNRYHHVISANTTPHRTIKSQPFTSPDKPPSLFIPSSFPSPSTNRIEDWSSQFLHTTQQNYGSSQVIGSIEDFSIPPPPPVEHD